MNQAVITGINIYRDSPEDTLRGCVNDAQAFNLRALNYLGFSPDQVTLLLDSQAVAERIKGHIFTAVKQSQAGDHILWTHSSHGTNEDDPTQADGLMELLCCHNTVWKGDRWDSETVISARFIGEMIDLLHPGARMDIILDCCHAPAGSQLKAMGLSYNRSRFMRRPEKVMGTPVNRLGTYKMPPNVCLWSACEPDQTSADSFIDGKWQGAFSAAFGKFFKAGRSRSDTIYYARNWLRDNRYDQVPHLYGKGLAGASFT